ncbi:MAG TPA: hypothetical protein VGG89_14470 [Candidatus Baltobacteraceae bacterium]
MAFDYLVFSEAQLAAALANGFITPDEVEVRERTRYLFGYLTTIGARSIIVETDYTDGDYLSDYASYYYSCFENYPRLCKRLHFFSASFDEELFKAAISNKNASAIKVLQESYLGFVVARPLPDAIIGRTILRTYDSIDRRHYPVIRLYRPVLAGIELPVKSLAFQEQDRVTAACATVALWSAFHMTSRLFDGTRRPRPSMITEMANVVRTATRAVPSHGLDVLQMCEAIRAAHLETEVVQISGATPLASIIYGYLEAGLPAILICDIVGVGSHAITLVGYSTPKEESDFREPPVSGVHSYASRINEFYGHDDQVGPFARMFIRAPKDTDEAKSVPFILEGSWKRNGSAVRLVPSVLLVPLYEKVRLRFLEMHAWIQRIMGVFKQGFPGEELEWNIRLTTTNLYKKELRSTRERPPLDLADILGAQQPRFFWRASLRMSGQLLFDVLGDATDFGDEAHIKYSFPLFRIVWYSESTRDAIGRLIAEEKDSVVKIWGSKLTRFMAGENVRLRRG